MSKTVLSSDSIFYKTENFIKLTKYVSMVDVILLKISETILLRKNEILTGEKKEKNDLECFKISTGNGKYAFYFKFGYQVGGGLNESDIVYFEYEEDGGMGKTVYEYITQSKDISFEIRKEKMLTKPQAFSRMYILSTTGVCLPRLSKEQKDVVETIDKNIIVQGVAGSGKTNICIDKIIFTACQNFKGRVLYTTFSRGLLMEAKLKVEEYKKDLQTYLDSYRKGNIIFIGNDKRKALENRLGIYFFSDDCDGLFDKVERVIKYLDDSVDYYLIEDIYRKEFGSNETFVGENYFINDYCKNVSNYQVEKAFGKLVNYSKEIIYKEIYGMILGYQEISGSGNFLSKDKYKLSRSTSFSQETCENIYLIAMDYYKHLIDKKLMDNNIASRKLLSKCGTQNWKYSLSIIDEVQDYTKVNLMMLKNMSLKVFAVGDASQMINPTYFSFAYLKNLLFDKDLTDIKELKSNYRNTPKIASIIENLNTLNKSIFGTHNFVIGNKSVDSGLETVAVTTRDRGFVDLVGSSNLDNFTFVVSDDIAKKELKKKIKTQEVLTVKEIKGLERDTIVVYNLLSDNIDKWKELDRKKVNHKQADENSIYRYYYNLFYVGLSRGKQNIFLIENENIDLFENFLSNNFEYVSSKKAFEKISKIVTTIEFTQEEVYARIYEFLKLEQYENARFTTCKILDDSERIKFGHLIDVHEKYIKAGHYREGGIKLWEYGLIEDARKQFLLSGDNLLIELMENCTSAGGGELSVDIVNYFDEVEDPFARNFILETLQSDLKKLKENLSLSKKNFKLGESHGKRN